MRFHRSIALVLALGLLLGAIAPVLAQARAPQAIALATPDRAAAIARAIDYLTSKQLPVGAFEGFSPGVADDFTTIKAVLAIAAVNRSQGTLTSPIGRGALAYLRQRAREYTHAQAGAGPLFPGRAGQLAVAVVAGDEDPSAFGGVNLVAELQASYDPASGAYATGAQEGFASGAASAINQLWAILGLAAAQQPIPTGATDYLAAQQEADGGWGFGSGGDVDTTALALSALIASGNVDPGSARVQSGLAFLRRSQLSTGGWASFGTLSADSTAVAMQALAAAGEVPTTAWLTAAGRTPLDELVGLQGADGSFGGNALGTAHALAGLAEAPLPIYGRAQRARLALTWLASQQGADGSWNGFAGPSAGATADAVVALAAARVDPATVRRTTASPSALDYLSASAAAFAATGPDAAGKLAVAVAAAGRDPRAFGGVDLVQVLNGQYRADQGAFGDRGNTWHQSFAILGLAAAGETPPPAAVQTLVGLQQPDGGWKYDLSPGEFNTTSPDNTGLALQALAAGGVAATSATVASATAFLRAKQDASAGWSNANSTALAIQGLLRVGEGFGSDTWTRAGMTPNQALASYQKRDGPFVYDPSARTDNLLATVQAVPALLGVTLPVAATTPLSAFAAVARPPDPDRLVALAPRGIVGPAGVDVFVPLGSDVNANASVTLSYRFEGGAFQPLPVLRGDGYATATIPGRQPGRYDLRATLADPDGLQGAAEQSGSATVLAHSVRLPVVARQALVTR